MVQQHRDGNTFAHSMVAAAVDRVANRPEEVTNFDRLAVIAGSGLEQTEANTVALNALSKTIKDSSVETQRLLRELLSRNGNGSKRFKDRAKVAALPTLGGGGLGFLMISKIIEMLS